MNPLVSGTLTTYSRPWPEASLLGFLHLGKGHPRVFWESEKSPLAFAGFGVAAQLTATGVDRFTQIASGIDQLFQRVHRVAEPDSTEAFQFADAPILAGGFSFQEGDNTNDPYWAAFPDAQFILPRFQLSRFKGETWLTLNQVLSSEESPEAKAAELREQADDLIWQGLSGEYAAPAVDDFPFESLRSQTVNPCTSHAAWTQMIVQTTDLIHQSDLKKVVLARCVHVEMDHSLPIAALLAHLAARYPDCYRFLFEPEPGHVFFGATPELLAEVTGRQLRTSALAGSLQRGKTWQEDQVLGQQLLTSRKDRQEHDYVVQAIKENLAPLTSLLEISPDPELFLLNNIQHLLTPVRGELANGSGILPVVQALHPTPALGGTPREAAIPLIQQFEALTRGWYGAPVGWFAPNGDGEFAVAIRSAVASQNQVRLYAGVGVIADSDPEKEWRETELKFQPILNALGL